MVVVYISGGAERSRTHFGTGSFTKNEMRAVLKKHGITVTQHASQKIDYILLPPGVDRPSRSTLTKTYNSRLGKSKPFLTWHEFERRFLKGQVRAVKREVRLTHGRVKGKGKGGRSTVGMLSLKKRTIRTRKGGGARSERLIVVKN